MKGGPLSSQPSKLVWPHKAICVMNGGDLDQTGRKYVGGEAHWTGLDFYATPLKTGGSGFGYHFCRSRWFPLFIDRVAENDMRGRLRQLMQKNAATLYCIIGCLTILCDIRFGAHSTVARPSKYVPQSSSESFERLKL